jgi:hypothetical protein
MSRSALFVVGAGLFFLLFVLAGTMVHGAVAGVRGIAAAVANHRAAVRSF